MKKIIILTVIFVLSIVQIVCGEEEKDLLIEEQYNSMNLSNIERAADQVMDREIQDIFPAFDLDRMTKEITSGKFQWDLQSIFKRIFMFFTKEIYANMKIMLQVIVLSIVLGILTNLQSSFGKKGINEIAFFACYILLVGILIKSFIYAADLGHNVIERMVVFMQSMIPSLVTLLVSTGNISSASIFQPTILFSVQIIAAVVKSFLIPLTFFITALSMVNNLSDKFQVTQLISFLKQLGKWTLGLLLTSFIGVITVQGLTASVIDGVGNKTMKFAVGNFVPIVGGILSDAVDTVIGCSLILKNAVGITGLAIIILICAVPIIKNGAFIILYRVAGAVIEPVSDSRIVKCVSQLADSLTSIFSMIFTTAVMFILSLTIVVAAGNISVMIR